MSGVVATIGVYGFDEETFCGRLVEAGVDTLVDVRRRRGVRGAQYAFSNSNRLQARLGEMGIRYLHEIGLAPTNEIRAAQYAADDAAGVGKRQRTQVSSEFARLYKDQILGSFSLSDFLVRLPPGVKVMALLCVESAPGACHRSMAADLLTEKLGWPRVDLHP